MENLVEESKLKVLLERIPGPAIFAAMALIYLALAQFVLYLNDPVFYGAGFWPAAGVSLGLLLLLPPRRWGWVIAGVAVAEFGGDIYHDYPTASILWWTLGNCVEPMVGALLIRRFSSPDGELVPVRKLMGFFVFGVIAGPVVGASIGSIGSLAFNPLSVVWPKYVIGDALGVLVMAPLLLVWKERTHARAWEERVGAVALPGIITLLVFRNWGVEWDVSLPYLIIPALIWTALRFGVREVAVASFFVAFIANYATATGYGAFAITGETHAVTLLQLYLVVVLLTALMVAALTSDLTDSKEIERRLASHNNELKAALEELGRSQLYLRKLEGILPICMGCKSVRSDNDKEWLALDEYLVSADAVSLSHTYCPTCTQKVLEDLSEPFGS
jgi:integral membrane sensor domain MASE1